MLTKTAEVFALRRAFDVALTPIEEMGFDETVSNIPADSPTPDTSPHGGVSKAAAAQNTYELHWLDDEPAVAANPEVPNNQAAPLNQQEQPAPSQPANMRERSAPFRPANFSLESSGDPRSAGPKQAVVNSNNNAGTNDGQRRRLF